MNDSTQAKLCRSSLLQSSHINIRRPTTTALRRQFSVTSGEVLRLANQCINDCITRETEKAERMGEQIKRQRVRHLKRRLLQYSEYDVYYGSKEEQSCLRAAPNTSLTKLIQSTASSVDVMSKYNRMLAVRIGSALMAEDIEAKKENYVQWNNQHNLSAVKSANFKRVRRLVLQMHFHLKHNPLQSELELTDCDRIVRCRPRREYSALSINRKKYW